MTATEQSAQAHLLEIEERIYEVLDEIGCSNTPKNNAKHGRGCSIARLQRKLYT